MGAIDESEAVVTPVRGGQGWRYRGDHKGRPTDLEYGAVLRVGSVGEAFFQSVAGVAEGSVGEEA